MHIDVVAVVPELLESPFGHSILKRAAEKGLFSVQVHDLRKYGLGAYKQIDDYAFGGGAGMVLMPEPLDQCIRELSQSTSYDQIIYLTPDGVPLNQQISNRLSLYNRLLILCGHYKGIDQRIRDKWVTMEISIGDYVLSGGELAAAVLVDSIGRLIPGVLNDETSALTDSFQDNLLAPPVYTRPADFMGMQVPEILVSGHQAKIDEWRNEQAYQRTRERRPDLLLRDEDV